MEREICSNYYPKIIEIETTINCPINPPCIMCDRAKIKESLLRKFIYRKDIHEKVINRLKPLLSNAETVSLHGLGEPLACKKLFKIIELINPNAEIMFNSNGMMLNEKTIDKILKSNIKTISFSIDAATSETYKKIRLDAFERVINNISNLIKERNSNNKQYPRILLNMTLMKENYREVIDFVKLAKEINADGVHFWPIKTDSIKKNIKKDFNFQIEEQKIDSYINKIKEYVRNAEKLANKENLIFSFYGINIKDASHKNPMPTYTNCNFPWNRIIVSLLGDVRFCCFSSVILGNLKKNSFEEVWNSEKAIKIRDSMNKGIIPENCKCKVSMPY